MGDLNATQKQTDRLCVPIYKFTVNILESNLALWIIRLYIIVLDTGNRLFEGTVTFVTYRSQRLMELSLHNTRLEFPFNH